MNPERCGLRGYFPDNNVYAMYKDSKGIVWYGTMFGLIMHDGSNYFRFRYDPTDSNSISNDDVVSIAEDRAGRLWFGTYYGGINMYDRTTGKFRRFTAERKQISDNTVWCIAEDRSGTLWAGSEDGLNRFDGVQWAKVNTGLADTAKLRVICLAEDERENLFAGTAGRGLIAADKERKNFRFFSPANSDQFGLDANSIRCLLSVKGKGIFAGSIGKGLYQLKYSSTDEYTFRFERTRIATTDTDTNTRLNIYSIVASENGDVFAGTGRGLFRVTETSGISILRTEIPYKSGQGIVSMMMAEPGLLYFSLYDAGLFSIDLAGGAKKNSVKANDLSGKPFGSIMCFAESEGKLFAAGNNGIYEFTGAGWAASELNKFCSGISINTMHFTGNNIWLGHMNGLILLSKSDAGIDILSFHEGITFTALISGAANELIAGTNDGIKIFDERSGAIIREFRNTAGDGNSLSENYILSLYRNGNGDIWAGTYAGLNLLKDGSQTFRRFSKEVNNDSTLISNYVYSILGHRGKMYFGTAGGLSVYDGSRFENYSVRNGFPDQVINSLALFNERIVAGANFSLSIFDTEDKTVAGVMKFDEVLNPSAVIQSGGSSFCFGSRNGIVECNLNTGLNEIGFAKIGFTRMRYDAGGKTIEIDLSETQTVTVPHDAQNIRLYFSDFRFRDNTATYYSRIEGIDKEWSFNDNRTYLSLKNLTPGEHDLYLRSVSGAGQSFVIQEPFTLEAEPPFYRTTLFYIFSVIAVTGAGWMFASSRSRHKLKRAMEIERAREEERELIRYEAARDYHDELGHKLTRISIYSRNLLRELESQRDIFSKELDKIMETSASLREGARDLIWSMDPGEDTLQDLALRIKDFAENMLHDTDISLHVSDIDGGLKNVKIDMEKKRNLLLIAKECINNSVKHSGASEISMSFVIEKKQFIMRISDNGTGMSPEGTKGYGLESMNRRAGKIGAELSIQGSKGNGTALNVKLNISLGKSEFSLN